MAFDFKYKLRMPSLMFWLQAAACAVVAWSLFHGGLGGSVGRGNNGTAAPVEGSSPAPAGAMAGTAPGSAPGAAGPAPGAAAQASAREPGLASAPPFGLALTTIDVIVTRNDTLDRIFRRLKLDLADLASLRMLPGVRTSLDALKPGDALHFTHKDGQLFGLQRRISDSETLQVVRDPEAGLKASVVQNPLEMRMRTVRGRIETSLFEAVEAAGAHDQIAVGLADIFGWDVDFVLDVRPGDTFVVTYPEIWRDGVYIKDGPIQAAEFVNQGRDFQAVRYADPNADAHYYTPDGRSLHRAFLRAPVEFTRVSSGFNLARYHPILNRIRAHKGVDYAAPIGTPVRAAGDGVVRLAGWTGGYGNMVEIEHGHGITTVYGHLSRFAHGVRAGTHVTQGTVIAYVGMTGLATGPHLHYEYRLNGVFKNPQTVSLPAAAPIDPRWREDFLAHSAPLLAALQTSLGPQLVSR
jgi:murein DD-endopeptidase MepM/ murein hydrolase activator NlpD